jgi:putative transposase
VASRGNEKEPVFKDAADRQNFLNTLQHVNKRYHWICHACCLMTNHYHLLIETTEGNLALGMRQLNGVYTQLFNKRHGRAGHLFQGRYKAILIQKDSHLLEVCRYVVLNLVRARMVGKPEDYSWSSYLATAGKEKPHSYGLGHLIAGRTCITTGRSSPARNGSSIPAVRFPDTGRCSVYPRPRSKR